jgi:hypothetical protein
MTSVRTIRMRPRKRAAEPLPLLMPPADICQRDDGLFQVQ